MQLRLCGCPERLPGAHSGEVAMEIVAGVWAVAVEQGG